VLAAALLLRRVAVEPLQRLAREVRDVARGDFEHPVRGAGAREVVGLGGDIDAMRARILAELDALRRAQEQLTSQAQDLQRSNAELEQFAYVASHDLQEPLRKVASFCQLLQRRYAGQLDERADQYIEFAVDGAKRMQSLISDLLSFSRVGRVQGDLVDVPLDGALDHALENLSSRIEDTGAVVEAGPLPVVRGEPILLAAVFQNLVGNALKFSGGERPIVRVTAERSGEDWVVSCSDEGIGIEPQYAERIFAIFQRLHAKEEYEGTGIGLALCRKIIDHHGGRIWLDTDVPKGTTFRFTIPSREDDGSA
jgi:light-regulated signal transduction histidine kinase (bacteriophytochrome)